MAFLHQIVLYWWALKVTVETKLYGVFFLKLSPGGRGSPPEYIASRTVL
jgi:hypothetical protein